ncbi:hypothetical protein [Roseimicrobium sp. ORNL1]|uniref:hypothetical protein n=1 Tax=Roseimicrobium sp. ORNL1 TaxID=2711231 RepID=UPI0013E14675|nr:hypothetical protein [Roseimicrobium sp. ORNL1]QIF01350.1 hypothetical protein G5S37_07385 [Roseimicrobium sp. ORNL1]
MKAALHSLVFAVTTACLSLPFSSSSAAENPAPASAGESSRIVELLVSDHVEVVAQGKAALESQQSTLIHSLLERIRSGDTGAKGRSAYELAIIISPWIRGKEAAERSCNQCRIDAPQRPVLRPVAMTEAATIRETLVQAIESLPSPPMSESLQYDLTKQAKEAMYEALGEVADDAIMDRVMQKLESATTPHDCKPLFQFATTYLGTPPAEIPMRRCGLGPPGEREAFLEEQAKTLVVLRQQLQDQWKAVRSMGQTDRIKYSMKSWRDRFVPFQESHSGNYYLSGSTWMFREMESLIRFGAPAVPLLRAQQSQETTLEARGVWEVLISTITGVEDEALMRELLAGSKPHLYLAPEIVVASGSKKWLADLDLLQQRLDMEEEKFSLAILSAHREEGIPALERGLARNKDNYHAEFALKELAARAERGISPVMRRFYFP